MITKFGTVYAGHVDLGDMGQDSTPANERRYGNEHLAGVFPKTDAIAKCMDEAGDWALWLAEHHFQHEGYEVIPNLLLHAVHLAHVTKRIKIGCGFNIAPMWHPLRLAEDYAMADILTNGRVIFGVGRGYHSREVETFGAPILDQEANRELFEEQVEIIFKAFDNERFSHHGKHYTLPPHVPYRGYSLRELTLVPRPIHRPVECWQPIVSARARRLGRGRGADRRALHEERLVVRRPARRADRLPARLGVALPGSRVRERLHQHGHAEARDARAAAGVRDGRD